MRPVRSGGDDRGTLRGHQSCKAQPHRDLRGFSRLKAHAIAAIQVKASSSQSGQRQHPLHRHRASTTLQCAATAAGPRQCPLARCCPVCWCWRAPRTTATPNGSLQCGAPESWVAARTPVHSGRVVPIARSGRLRQQ
ncbi:hypothetical protein PF002_g13308 [Phytophthora fragariae]|uniref:Uncharacterized protein n=1 Tax=Phytophthora fragariae TaxID=53985 RepID=A0A6A3Z6Y0_9STRA|nr:hypothetical protein PF002_g13308 [Phytophthora fragariae]